MGDNKMFPDVGVRTLQGSLGGEHVARTIVIRNVTDNYLGKEICAVCRVPIRELDSSMVCTRPNCETYISVKFEPEIPWNGDKS